MAERGGDVGGITIRRSLVRNLVLLVVAVSGAVLALTIYQSTRAVEELSQSLVQRSTMQVHTSLEGFFGPVRRQLRTVSDWGGGGLLTPIDPPRLTPMALPILRRQPHVSSLLVAQDGGHGYMLLEQADGYRRREVWPSRFSGRAHWAQLGRRGELLRRWEEAIDYDPRTRPWFSGAVDAGGRIAWTEPYTFFTTGDPGITASATFDDPRSDEVHVVGLDVLLSDVSRFTTELDVSPHGAALVLADDGRVVGLPRDARLADDTSRREAVLAPASELGIAPARVAWSEWQALGQGERVFPIEVDGEGWWVGMRPYRLSPERRLWIQVLVPERDFLGRVHRQRDIIIGIVFVALVLAVLVALLLARSYSRPLEALAAQAEKIRTLDLDAPEPVGSALKEVRLLTEAQERMRAAIDSFSRYVPVEVVRELIRRGEVARLGGRTATLSVMFTDIAGFTTISESMRPEELTAHMGGYFDAVLEEVRSHRGTVDKMIGDAVMAFWGAPIDDADHARHALEAVLAIQAALATLDARWEDEGKPRLPTRFGLHAGEVVVGNVGSRTRLSYTVLGDTVNLAARLEGANKAYGTWVLASEGFKRAVGDGFEWRLVDHVGVKGRARPIEIYEPLGREGEVDEARLAFARTYEAAFDAYRRREWQAAVDTLAPLGDEPSAARLRARCEALLATPPDDDWVGVTRLTEK
ncbi:MAG: adenylate/guanylate cyclase domain-containing protein [Sandaracinaceae bacterium]